MIILVFSLNCKYNYSKLTMVTKLLLTPYAVIVRNLVNHMIRNFQSISASIYYRANTIRFIRHMLCYKPKYVHIVL